MTNVVENNQKSLDGSQLPEAMTESLVGGKYLVLRTSDNWHSATVINTCSLFDNFVLKLMGSSQIWLYHAYHLCCIEESLRGWTVFLLTLFLDLANKGE